MIQTNLKDLEEHIKLVNEYKPFELITSKVCKMGSVYGPCTTCMFKELYMLDANYSYVPRSPMLVNSMYCLHLKVINFEDYINIIEKEDQLSHTKDPYQIDNLDSTLYYMNKDYRERMIRAINNYKLFKSKSHV